MPINPNTLPTPQPDEPEAASQPEPAAEPPKRRRRGRAQMIADAVVPADDAVVEVKDSASGAKVERSWIDAVALVKADKAEFVDREHHYAMLKLDQQEAASAFATSAEPEAGAKPTAPESAHKPPEIPEGAELGDEVVVGSDVYRVGHGALVQGSVSDGASEIISPKRRWQRALGTGVEGPWESHALAETNGSGPAENATQPEQPPTVETERLPMEVEQVTPTEWRVGMGILDKIGLPSRGGEWSSLQVGPITSSRTVVDDGRRTLITLNGKQQAVPTAAIEASHEVCAMVEYIGNYMRGELTSFLQTQGVVLTPLVPA